MNSVKEVDKHLQQAIADIVINKEQYVKNPASDFTRKRKLEMSDVIKQILAMNGGSLKKELYEFAKSKKTTLTASAFVQQRSKICNRAFKDLFYSFNRCCHDSDTYRGYRVIGVDGSDINCPRNPQSNTFISSKHYPEGYNQMHLNALYDICNKVFLDIETQPRLQMDERQCLIDMLKRNRFETRTMFITDRGYESYNMFAHFLNTPNVDFLCRVKQGVGAMKEVQKLPFRELDVDITIGISTSQSKEDKVLGRRFIQIGSQKGKINSPKTVISKWDFPSPYTLNFRVVRFLLDTGEYETLATSLPRDKFSLKELKELYHMRWGIETSFRDLKYAIGLTHLHSKKDELILQEIYAAVIMYNYCSRMSGSVVINHKHQCKHAYKVSFVMAIYLCKRFFVSTRKDFDGLIRDIGSYTEPIRTGRQDKRKLRKQRFVGFIYRVAA